jgi:hypothetical protein
MENPTQGNIGNNISDAERRLWLAVVVQAVEDWRTGTLRARRIAHDFMFGTTTDFETVCANAGLDAGNLRSKLMKISRQVPAPQPWNRQPVAA